MIIKDWRKMRSSMAVWLPTVATAVIAGVNYANEAHLIPAEYLPFVVLVTGFVGRIIKQKSISGVDHDTIE